MPIVTKNGKGMHFFWTRGRLQPIHVLCALCCTVMEVSPSFMCKKISCPHSFPCVEDLPIFVFDSRNDTRDCQSVADRLSRRLVDSAVATCTRLESDNQRVLCFSHENCSSFLEALSDSDGRWEFSCVSSIRCAERQQAIGFANTSCEESTFEVSRTFEGILARTDHPTEAPSFSPSDAPTRMPTSAPTIAPTNSPIDLPTNTPTLDPTRAPTASPTGLSPSSPVVHPVSSTAITQVFRTPRVPKTTPKPPRHATVHTTQRTSTSATGRNSSSSEAGANTGTVVASSIAAALFCVLCLLVGFLAKKSHQAKPQNEAGDSLNTNSRRVVLPSIVSTSGTYVTPTDIHPAGQSRNHVAQNPAFEIDNNTAGRVVYASDGSVRPTTKKKTVPAHYAVVEKKGKKPQYATAKEAISMDSVSHDWVQWFQTVSTHAKRAAAPAASVYAVLAENSQYGIPDAVAKKTDGTYAHLNRNGDMEFDNNASAADLRGASPEYEVVDGFGSEYLEVDDAEE
eukprot:m.1406701 g.1406701  ORF g.1406701 m.1406701 type:complete len:510 (+) comp25014_c0_seq13:32-1561(+)